jgi:hypothetical protein
MLTIITWCGKSTLKLGPRLKHTVCLIITWLQKTECLDPCIFVKNKRIWPILIRISEWAHSCWGTSHLSVEIRIVKVLFLRHFSPIFQHNNIYGERELICCNLTVRPRRKNWTRQMCSQVLGCYAKGFQVRIDKDTLLAVLTLNDNLIEVTSSLFCCWGQERKRENCFWI